MSNATTTIPPALDTCGCCQQTDAATAPVIDNPAGQAALSARIGIYGSFLDAMIRRLPLFDLAPPGAPPNRPLAALASRDPTDPTLALVDAWASALDVLTFYQERIANEGYLRTATERLSVLQIARALGYELSPGLAATADLAFTVETAAGSPGTATIAVGTKVMSVPGQNESPQFFETIESIETRAEWNAFTLPPLVTNTLSPETAIVAPSSGAGSGSTSKLTDLFVQGVSFAASKGDAVLFLSSDPTQSAFRVLNQNSTPVPSAGSTRLQWDTPLPTSSLPSPVVAYIFRQRAGVFGSSAPDWRGLPSIVRAGFGDTNPNPSPDPPTITGGMSFTVANPQGGTTVDLDNAYPGILPGSLLLLLPSPGGAQDNVIAQNNLFTVSSVTLGSRADFAINGRITKVVLGPPTQGASMPGLGGFGVRATAVLAQSEALLPGSRPIASPPPLDARFPPAGTSLTAPGFVVPLNVAGTASGAAVAGAAGTSTAATPGTVTQTPAGLEAGRRIIIAGRRIRVQATSNLPSLDEPNGPIVVQAGEVFILLEPPGTFSFTNASGQLQSAFRWKLQRLNGDQLEIIQNDSASPPRSPPFARIPADPSDPVVGEVATLSQDVVPPFQQLVLTLPPQLEYDNSTVTVFANVVRATHGETVQNEVLGSGSPTSNLAFTLKRPPLTYVPSTDVLGATSTLAVRVNDVLWSEAPSLFGLGPRQASYMVRVEDGGQTTVTFGDGVSGARLPTGTENVVATYRTGLGPAGNVRANALSLLITRPIGIRSVTNPLPGSGGVPPASLDQARAATPRSLRASGRVVSVQDAEDFSAAFVGVGNAQATLLGVGSRQLAHVTVADIEGNQVSIDSPLLGRLTQAIQAVADPSFAVVVGTYDPLPFVLQASVMIDPAFDDAAVTGAASDALTAAFAVNGRPFGQRITEAEIVSIVQRVAGVVAVTLTALHIEGDPSSRETSIVALPARLDVLGNVQPAQALVLALGNPVLNPVSS